MIPLQRLGQLEGDGFVDNKCLPYLYKHGEFDWNRGTNVEGQSMLLTQAQQEHHAGYSRKPHPLIRSAEVLRVRPSVLAQLDLLDFNKKGESVISLLAAHAAKHIAVPPRQLWYYRRRVKDYTALPEVLMTKWQRQRTIKTRSVNNAATECK